MERMKLFLEISAPNVDSFVIRHYPKGRQLRFTTIPSLTKAYIDFNGSDWDTTSEEVMRDMKGLLDSIQHVEELELGSRCIEIISMLVVNGWQPPQSKRWGLVINASSDNHNISGIIGLLEFSPDLRIMVIDGYEPSGASITADPTTKHDLDCDLLHLKTVQIIIHELAGEPLLTIAQNLLERAPALVMMLIDIEEFKRVRSTASSLASNASTLSSTDIVKLSQAVKIGDTVLRLLRCAESSQKAVFIR